MDTKTPLIYEAIINVMQEVKPITKDRENKYYKFKYRGIEDVYQAVQPLFAKYGIFSVPKVIDISREERPTKEGKTLFSVLTIQYKFYAKDGSFIEVQVLGEASDTGDKSINKAMSAGHKYALFQLFCIPTDDMPDPDADAYSLTNQSNNKRDTRKDKENNTPQPKSNLVTKVQIASIKTLIKDLGYQSDQDITSKVNEWLAKGSHTSIKVLEDLSLNLAESLIKNLIKAKDKKEIKPLDPTMQEENIYA